MSNPQDIKITAILPPKERIAFSNEVESPRQHTSSLGWFVGNENGYLSPDAPESFTGMERDSTERKRIHGDILSAMREAKDYKMYSNGKEYAEEVRKMLVQRGYNDIVDVFPVWRHEHGDSHFHMYGHNITPECVYVVFKHERMTNKKKRIEVIKRELEEYSNWCNGHCIDIGFTKPDGEDQIWTSHYGSLSDFDIKSMVDKEWAEGLEGVDLDKLHKEQNYCSACGRPYC